MANCDFQRYSPRQRASGLKLTLVLQQIQSIFIFIQIFISLESLIARPQILAVGRAESTYEEIVCAIGDDGIVKCINPSIYYTPGLKEYALVELGRVKSLAMHMDKLCVVTVDNTGICGSFVRANGGNTIVFYNVDVAFKEKVLEIFLSAYSLCAFSLDKKLICESDDNKIPAELKSNQIEYTFTLGGVGAIATDGKARWFRLGERELYSDLLEQMGPISYLAMNSDIVCAKKRYCYSTLLNTKLNGIPTLVMPRELVIEEVHGDFICFTDSNFELHCWKRDRRNHKSNRFNEIIIAGSSERPKL